MKTKWGQMSGGILASVLCLGVFAPSYGQEGARPGQLKNVLSALKNDGKTWFREGTGWLLEREYVSHMLFMATDPRGGVAGGGWYRPSQSRYSWDWLRDKLDKDRDDVVSFGEFTGPREWFEALDKDRNSELSKEDFDWSSDSPLNRASAQAKPLFGQIDRNSNGQVSPEEWKEWFDKLGGDKGFLSVDDLLPLFLESRRPTGKSGKASIPSFMRDRLVLTRSFLSCDVGALSEGPALGEQAPYFTLTTQDGKGKLFLGNHQGQKPLVLIFGSFT